jgi:hypothetical protein
VVLSEGTAIPHKLEMPIEVDSTPDGLVARQSFDAPTVYFDHWAIRLFSDDLRLQDRFVRTLSRKRGTFVLSHLSVFEFTKSEDARHCRSAEVFLERLLPDIYFTDFRFDSLIAQERQEPDNQTRFPPSPNRETLEHFVAHGTRTAGYLTMHGFLHEAHGYRELFLDRIGRSLQEFRVGLNKARSDPTYIAKARRARPTPERTRTMIILGELLRDFNLDESTGLSANDLVDIMHAAMPVNCCDYVLLDGRWADQVRKMRDRIAGTGHAMPVAKCFSRQDDGIERLLTELALLPRNY